MGSHVLDMLEVAKFSAEPLLWFGIRAVVHGSVLGWPRLSGAEDSPKFSRVNTLLNINLLYAFLDLQEVFSNCFVRSQVHLCTLFGVYIPRNVDWTPASSTSLSLADYRL